MQKELQELEKQRKGVMVWDIVTKTSIAISILVSIIVAVKDATPERAGIGLVLFVILFLAIALTGQVLGFERKRKTYALHYKRLFVKEALNHVFTDVCYYENGEIDVDKIEETEMITMGNRYRGEDYISGKYKGVFFEQADLCIQNCGGKSTTTFFEGRWIIFNVPNYGKYEMAGKTNKG